VSPILVEGLVVLAAVFGWRAIRHLSPVFRDPDHRDASVRLIRGIRAVILAATSLVFALGIAYESKAMLLIAAVILGEELYETGVVLLILRRHRRRDD
jgi:hypothetical protein